MSITHEQNIILNVIKWNPGLGKTKLMKIIYMLQQVKNIMLGYDFDIYTYGPYSSEVLESLDELVAKGLVSSKMIKYPNYVGYELHLTEEGDEKLSNVRDDEEKAINDIISFADKKNAKDLELYSTIIFIDEFYSRTNSGNGKAEVTQKVSELKPCFDSNAIFEAYSTLENKGYLSA